MGGLRARIQAGLLDHPDRNASPKKNGECILTVSDELALASQHLDSANCRITEHRFSECIRGCFTTS